MRELLKSTQNVIIDFSSVFCKRFPKSLAVDNVSVIEVESLWKSKLNTIEFGLNDN